MKAAARRLCAASSGERGQVLPVLMVLFVGILAVGIILFQGGRASLLRAEGVTAADAAAVGGAYELRDQLLAIMMKKGFADPNLVSQEQVCARAAQEADANDGQLIGCDQFGFEVWVQVATDESLDGEGAAEGVGDGRHGVAEATARLDLTYSIGFGGAPAWGPGANALGMSVAELKDLADKAGVKLSLPSSLQSSVPCTMGVDTINLSDEMKIAILRAEAILGGPLQLNDGFRTYACQVDRASNPSNPGGRAAPPGHSLHEAGMAVDVGNWQALAPIAHRVGLCQPFPAPDDDPVHFSLQNGVECGGVAGVIGAGGAFGGNPGSFVSFEVTIVE